MPNRNLTSLAVGSLFLIVFGATGVVTARSAQRTAENPLPTVFNSTAEAASIPASTSGAASTGNREGQSNPNAERRHLENAGTGENRRLESTVVLSDELPEGEADRPADRPAADRGDVAGPAADGRRVRHRVLHRVHLSEDGLVPGRLFFVDPIGGDRIALQEIRVHFVRNGRIVAAAEPGVGGVFQAPGLGPGVYSVIAAGPEGFLATSVEILPPLGRDNGLGANVDAAAEAPVAATSLELRSVPIPAAHLDQALELIRSRLSPAAASLAARRPGAERPPLPPPVPERDGDDDDVPPNGWATIEGAHQRVALQPDGRLTGLVRRLAPVAGLADVEVYILQDGRIAGRALTDERGRFELHGVQPGFASFVAVGRAGMAAFSFEVLRPNDPRAENLNTTLGKTTVPVSFVLNRSMQPAGTVPLDAALIDPGDFGAAQSIIDQFGPPPGPFVAPPPAPLGPEFFPPAAPMGGGFFGGGGGGVGGGGGGLFGGPLGGALIGAGVGAGVGAAIASSRSRRERVIVISPVFVE